jgi:RNA polymerase sigma-70 factor (ECF subfamily)
VKTPGLVDHFFRHDYGRLVAILTRRVGMPHIERVEDAVQSSLMAALTAWERGAPEDPGAWLYRVAWNRLIEDLRRESGRSRARDTLLETLAPEQDDPADQPFAEEIRDDMLRMLFVCCDDAIPRESQLAVALKILCGFSVPEIALRLFTSEANIRKRLTRARERFRQLPLALETPLPQQLQSRLSGVHAVLYLLFNEGYLSARPEQPLRRELCEEAIRLATLIAEHPVGATPESCALLALMHLHLARFGSRVGAEGELLLLHEQDRSTWDPDCSLIGMRWLQRSACGAHFSRFHAEAAIAAEHCIAPSFEQTRWQKIADLYGMLESIAPSPLHRLHRAVAIGEWQGPQAGLAAVEQLAPPEWLERSYLWQAVLADLHRRADHHDAARRYRERALECAPTTAVRKAIERRSGRE